MGLEVLTVGNEVVGVMVLRILKLFSSAPDKFGGCVGMGSGEEVRGTGRRWRSLFIALEAHVLIRVTGRMDAREPGMQEGCCCCWCGVGVDTFEGWAGGGADSSSELAVRSTNKLK